MKLNADSVTWAFSHLVNFNDSDLFPKPVELDIVAQYAESTSIISGLDLENLDPNPHRRFIVPKDDLSYRIATQLDPLDSVILAALIYQFGQNIEDRRRSISERFVFSHRFKPDDKGNFYDDSQSWNAFWAQCLSYSRSHSYAVVMDIADFYNQIYHHVIENQLINSEFPNQAVRWLLHLIKSTTAQVSRGIPVGPHSAHMLAEASMIPVDNSLAARGYIFCRYVDDIIVFCNSEMEAKEVVLEMANILDKQQKLLLQRQKTKIESQSEFQQRCAKMLEDRPINDLEKNLLEIFKKYTRNNPYRRLRVSDLSSNDLKAFDKASIEKILSEYLEPREPDYIRLRWFIRRLAQVGHPAAVDYCIKHMDSMAPAMNEIANYFVSVGGYQGDWLSIGEELLALLDHPLIKKNDYLQLSVLSLFNRRVEVNHFDKLIRKADSSIAKRELILSAWKNNYADWIREQKENFPSMDPWTKRAFLVAAQTLPAEERGFFYRSVHPDTLDNIIIKWIKQS
ncbi:RNA-directed DNA polymerase [Sulfobacillus thermosulfidooxidans]|uniref:RNA-directed DNA polymerase n=1 Tax=Sulfobacillus thermosulfidooxidans TaxID=28034 RepID=UPI0006B4B034|nr:RNA-directed DNA polymerase [Sulfobacillus thermosulfidooxidans]